jgi:hypothetical protein
MSDRNFEIIDRNGTPEVREIQEHEDPKSAIISDEAKGINRGMAQVDIGTGEVSEHGVTTVNTHRDAPASVVDSVQTLHGSPANLADALNDPSNYTVEIQGNRCTLEAAVKAGLVLTDSNTINEVKSEPETPSEAPQAEQFMSNGAKLYVNTCRDIGSFDEALSAVLAHVGAEEGGNKLDSALERYGRETGASSIENARNAVNELINDVMTNTSEKMAAQYGEENTVAAIEHLMKNVEQSTRASIFRGLVNGDGRMLYRIIEMYQLNNIY